MTAVQVEKAKSRAAEQACHKAQEEAQRSAKHLNQVIVKWHCSTKVSYGDNSCWAIS